MYSIQCISVRSTAAGRMIQRGVFGDKKVTSKRISLLHFTISYDKEMHSRSAHCCTRTVRCKGQEMYKCPVQSMQVHTCTKQTMHSVHLHSVHLHSVEVSCKQRKALHKGEPGTLSSIHPGFVIIIIFLIASIIINPKESLPFLQ